MTTPNPQFQPSSLLEVVSASTLFQSTAIRRRSCGSFARLDSGRLLMAFRVGTAAVQHNDGAVMLTSSQDNGKHWEEPMPIYAYPGWNCLPMGGIARFTDDFIRLIIGRVIVDRSLGGDEPFNGWYISSIDSHDG
ncbi:MAG: exo-alpha-sialidase, partial [Chloroflexi bacterium]|nr:exo-alpha-sialidase [Chloroflexota bacterium]